MMVNRLSVQKKILSRTQANFQFQMISWKYKQTKTNKMVHIKEVDGNTLHNMKEALITPLTKMLI